MVVPVKAGLVGFVTRSGDSRAAALWTTLWLPRWLWVARET
jgi:hypothetical protein